MTDDINRFKKLTVGVLHLTATSYFTVRSIVLTCRQFNFFTLLFVSTYSEIFLLIKENLTRTLPLLKVSLSKYSAVVPNYMVANVHYLLVYYSENIFICSR